MKKLNHKPRDINLSVNRFKDAIFVMSCSIFLFMNRVCVLVLEQNEFISATYYYAALNDSEFAFAFSLSDTDRVS